MARRTRVVSGDETLDELITEHPETSVVFIRRRMHCVGCDLARFETLRDASRAYHQSFDEILDEIRRLLFQNKDVVSVPGDNDVERVGERTSRGIP
jgi:hybrid cluster-associated redox disulfide protein